MFFFILHVLTTSTVISAQFFGFSTFIPDLDELSLGLALVEYKTIKGSNPNDTLDKNGRRYIEIVNNISNLYPVQVIVFPESTLEGGDKRDTEDLKNYGTPIQLGSIPCNFFNVTYPNYLRNLSCICSKLRMSLLINMVEENTGNWFSSDLFINDNGIIQASLRLDDRIGDPTFRRKPTAFEIPVRRVFTIVTNFGQFLSFTPTSMTSAFRYGQEKAFAPNETRHYLVCSNWISELPFLTSLQVYQMWAEEYNVSVYFSGASNPGAGQGGSGAYYAGYGPVFMDFMLREDYRIHILKVFFGEKPTILLSPYKNRSIDEMGNEMDQFTLNKQADITNYTSQILDLTKTIGDVTLCHEEYSFCCHFYTNISAASKDPSKKHYTYHYVAYKGPKSYHRILEPGGIETCAVIACLDDKIDSCGSRFQHYNDIQWYLTFQELKIEANFSIETKHGIFVHSQFPNSLLSSIRPIHPNHTLWTKEIVEGKLQRSFSLRNPQDRLLTFAIFGRNFSLGPNNQPFVTKSEEDNKELEGTGEKEEREEKLRHSSTSKSTAAYVTCCKISLVLSLLIIF